MMYVKYDAEEIRELIRQDVNKNNETYKAAGEVFFTIGLEGRRERELVVTVTNPKEENKMIKYANGKTRKQVKEEYPEHVKIVKVDGGYAVFETWDDYEIWRNQK